MSSEDTSPKLAPDTPVMTYQQMIEGQSLMMKFLKKIEVRVKGEKVTTTYFWEFPDKIIAKTFAEQIKAAFESGAGR